jgi:hypothetical protein
MRDGVHDHLKHSLGVSLHVSAAQAVSASPYPSLLDRLPGQNTSENTKIMMQPHLKVIQEIIKINRSHSTAFQDARIVHQCRQTAQFGSA